MRNNQAAGAAAPAAAENNLMTDANDRHEAREEAPDDVFRRLSIPSFLACPACKGPLMAGERESGSGRELICPSCELAYGFSNAGIALMTQNAARPLTPEEARKWRAKRDQLRRSAL